MNSAGDQQLKKEQEQMEITVHAAPVEQEAQQPVTAQPIQLQAAPVEEQREQEENAALAAQVQRQLPAAHAAAAAPGAPVQEEVPAKQSFKERRREKKHAEMAKKVCPVGTAATYDIHTGIQRSIQGKENALAPHKALAAQQGVDDRVLRIFAPGYQLNKKGRPASPEDAAAKQQADAFIQDYCSKDLQRRRPHLQRMVDDLLAIQFSPEMFSQRNLRKNAAQLKELGDQMTYIDNVMKDPVNKPFFDQMDPVRRERLKAATDTVYGPFVKALLAGCQKNGVAANSGEYYDKDYMSIIDMGRTSQDARVQALRDGIGQLRTQETAIAARQAVRVQNAAQDHARTMEERFQVLDQLKKDNRVKNMAEGVDPTFLTRSVMLLEPGEEHYEENRERVVTCLEIGDGLKTKQVSPELYQKARDMLAPRVQRVLDCDVEYFAQLSDEALLLQSPQLNELFRDNMFVSDMLKLRHPSHEWHRQTGEYMTLEDELVGQRGVEYSYKLNMLRGLAERARGLALLRQAEAGSLSRDYLTRPEQVKVGDGSITDFAASRIKTGDTQIATARASRQAMTDLNSPQFRQWLEERIFNAANQMVAYDSKFDAVIQELDEQATPELQEAVNGVSRRAYRSLAHSPAELAAMGRPENIGEAIFRAFSNMAAMDATQTLLTPQQFRQMVLDLGAGGNLTYDTATQAQREAAVAQNNRGLAVFKQVARAQYDMIERKYGDRLDHLTIPELCAHYGDLARDFGYAQAMLSMATRHPDFLDPDDPEDQMLLKRIEYYAIQGNSAVGLLHGIFGGVISDDSHIAELMQTTLEARENGAAEGKDYLTANRPDFVRQAIDWDQKVVVNIPKEDVAQAAFTAVQEQGVEAAAQVVTDMLREEGIGEQVAQQMREEVARAVAENGPMAAMDAAAQAVKRAMWQTRSAGNSPAASGGRPTAPNPPIHPSRPDQPDQPAT